MSKQFSANSRYIPLSYPHKQILKQNRFFIENFLSLSLLFFCSFKECIFFSEANESHFCAFSTRTIYFLLFEKDKKLSKIFLFWLKNLKENFLLFLKKLSIKIPKRSFLVFVSEKSPRCKFLLKKP